MAKMVQQKYILQFSVRIFSCITHDPFVNKYQTLGFPQHLNHTG